MRIGHISDLHILEFDQPRPLEFLNKRLVGGLNLFLNRSKAHSAQVVEQAIRRLDELDVDHILISGDLTNLALESEFAAARRIVDTIDDSLNRVSVVPGNHDYYTPEAVRARRFEHYFEPYLKSDLPEFQGSSGYPFCHLREDVAIIGVNSGIATPWLFASGRVDDDELALLDQLLDAPEVKERFKIVLIHHPLLPDEHHAVQFYRQLLNREEVLDLLRRKNVDLITHGHNHYLSLLRVPKLGAAGTTYISEAGSTSMDSFGDDPTMAGKFNIYTIEDGKLQEVETHLFESAETGFRPWRTEIFRHELQED